MSAFLDWLRPNWARVTAAVVVAVIAGVTGTISYGHIAWLTLALGASALVAHLMPFAVDGQIIMGSIVLLAAKGSQRHWGWLGIVPGLVESLFANYEAGIPHGHLAAVWYMVAAQSFAVACFLLERLVKSLASQSRPGGQDGRDEQVTDPDAEPADAPEPPVEYVTVEVPVSCGHEHPGSVDEAIVSAFLHARDCEGEEISQRELSRRFGQSRARVAELVGPLVRPAAQPSPDEGDGGEDAADREPEAASA